MCYSRTFLGRVSPARRQESQAPGVGVAESSGWLCGAKPNGRGVLQGRTAHGMADPGRHGQWDCNNS